MTVNTTYSFQDYTGDGATTDFIFDFPCFEESWMYGIVDGVFASGAATLNPDQESGPGGTFAFDVAPALDAEVTVLRIVDLTQLTDYPPYTRFPAKDHEEALDKLTMIAQQYDLRLDDIDTALANDFLRLDGTNWPDSVLRVSENWGLQEAGSALIITPTLPDGTGDPGLAQVYFEPTLGAEDLFFALFNDTYGPVLTYVAEDGGGDFALRTGDGLPFFQAQPGDVDANYDTGQPMLNINASGFNYYEYLSSGSGRLSFSNGDLEVIATEGLTAITTGAEAVTLFGGGVAALRTTIAASGSAEVYNTVTGAGWERVLTESDLSAGGGDFYANGSVAMTGNLRANVADWDIVNEFTGGDLTIGVTDPGGTPRDFIFCDASAGVSLSFGGTYTARTLPHVDGGLQANNTLNGTGWERVLTESDLGELTSVDLNGDLTGGPVLIHKNNETVTITYDSENTPSHAGATTTSTLAGLVPVGFRPTHTVRNVYLMTDLGIYMMEVLPDGSLRFIYRDYAGLPVSLVTCGPFTITYAIGEAVPPS